MRRRLADAFDGKHFLVCEKRCNQCLFSSAKIVGDERKEDLLTGTKKSGKYFICHKSPSTQPVVCRGFYDEEPNRACTTARVLGLVRFVNPESPHVEILK